MQRAKRQRELECGFTLFGWDGDTLAWESSPPRDDGDTGRTVHYLYEPGSFVPVAQALRNSPIRLHKQPDWSQREYNFDQDPLWQTEMKPQGFDAIAWYHCDHLGTPIELTDEQGNLAWAGQYKAWGEVSEKRSDWSRQHGMSNPIRFQGQYHDQETGLHYNRYRYYDPKTGRFVAQDPIRYWGGLNLFSYAVNPVEWVDPLGLAKKPPSTFAKTDGQGVSPQVMAESVVNGGNRTGQQKVRDSLIDQANEHNNGVYVCWRCGQTSTNPDDMHLGHTNVPTSKGGNLAPCNTALEGAACNLSAGNSGYAKQGMSCVERGSCGAPYGR
ncbi:RHS repeat-associated core domain-containing protein [Pantoea sp. Cy-639]|nr:RHS repeat-associated core domain-containing protein [Pantoea sp. Cy-639]